MAKHKRDDETPADVKVTPDAGPDTPRGWPEAPDAPVPHAGEAPRAADGMPAAEGNRDDAAERDMGLRDESVMGTPPAAGKSDGGEPETDAQKVRRLEKELAEARAGLDALVPRAAQAAMGLDPKAKAKGGAKAAGARAEPELPGEGDVVWEGSIRGNPLFPALRFRGTGNEAEAREAYQRHAGIKSTTGTVVVTRVTAEPAKAKKATAPAAAKPGKK